MNEDLDKLEKLLADAEPGPWAVDNKYPGITCSECGEVDTVDEWWVTRAGQRVGIIVAICGDRDEATAKLVLASHEALPKLIVELREFRAAKEKEGSR